MLQWFSKGQQIEVMYNRIKGKCKKINKHKHGK